jgi:hypothetical protein
MDSSLVHCDRFATIPSEAWQQIDAVLPRCLFQCSFTLLDRQRRDEVVSHSERGRGALLHKRIEQKQNRIPKVALALQLKGSAENISLEENFKVEDGIAAPQQSCRVAFPEVARNPNERHRQ